MAYARITPTINQHIILLAEDLDILLKIQSITRMSRSEILRAGLRQFALNYDIDVKGDLKGALKLTQEIEDRAIVGEPKINFQVGPPRDEHGNIRLALSDDEREVLTGQKQPKQEEKKLSMMDLLKGLNKGNDE